MKYLQTKNTNNLFHNKNLSSSSSRLERNGYRGVVGGMDGKVDYNFKDMKYTPFTVHLLGKGKVSLFLLPYLNIMEPEGLVHSITCKVYSYLDSVPILYGEYYWDYDRNDCNMFTTPELPTGSHVRFEINWSGQAGGTLRSLSYSKPNGYDLLYTDSYPDDFIGSCINATCKYEVYGNIASLLCHIDEIVPSSYRDTEVFSNDEYISTIAGNFTFAGLFQNNDESGIDVELEERDGEVWEDQYSSEVVIFGDVSTNTNLVNARNLYLPSITKPQAYAFLFASCSYLKYGPQKIYINAPQNLDTSNYYYMYNNMFKGCSRLTDYWPIIEGNIYYKTTGITNNPYTFFGMFGGAAIKGCTISIKNNNTTIYANSSFSPFFRMFYPSNTIINYVYIHGSHTLSNSIATCLNISQNKLKSTFDTEPIIWVDRFSYAMDRPTLSNENLETFLGDYQSYAKPYRFCGTCWVDDDCRSYYMWEIYENLLTSEDIENLDNYIYILTSEKDFSGMNMIDTANNFYIDRKHNIAKYVLSTDSEQTYNIDNETPHSTTTNQLGLTFIPGARYLVYWNGIIPDAEAGRPHVWVDRRPHKESGDPTYSDWIGMGGGVNYDIWLQNINYSKSFYRCDEYEMIEHISFYDGYLWKYVGHGATNNSLKHRTNIFYDESYSNINYMYTETSFFNGAAFNKFTETHDDHVNLTNNCNPINLDYEGFISGKFGIDGNLLSRNSGYLLTNDVGSEYGTANMSLTIRSNEIHPDACDFRI